MMRSILLAIAVLTIASPSFCSPIARPGIPGKFYQYPEYKPDPEFLPQPPADFEGPPQRFLPSESYGGPQWQPPPPSPWSTPFFEDNNQLEGNPASYGPPPSEYGPPPSPAYGAGPRYYNPYAESARTRRPPRYMITPYETALENPPPQTQDTIEEEEVPEAVKEVEVEEVPAEVEPPSGPAGQGKIFEEAWADHRERPNLGREFSLKDILLEEKNEAAKMPESSHEEEEEVIEPEEEEEEEEEEVDDGTYHTHTDTSGNSQGGDDGPTNFRVYTDESGRKWGAQELTPEADEYIRTKMLPKLRGERKKSSKGQNGNMFDIFSD